MNVNLIFLIIAGFLIEKSFGENKYDLDLIDRIKNERECAMQGGMCVIAEDCSELTAVKGLCPDQRSMGVECCYGISNKETRCKKRGGECLTASIGCRPQDNKATDCKDDDVCCILL